MLFRSVTKYTIVAFTSVFSLLVEVNLNKSMHDAFNGITTVVSHRRPLNARKTIKCDPSIKYYKTEISNNKIDLIKQCLPVVLFIILRLTKGGS